MYFQNSISICAVICSLIWKKSLGIPCLCPLSDPNNFEVEFYISTQSNLDQRYDSRTKKKLTDFDFSPKLKTAVIVHGFLSTHKANSIVNMRDAFLQWENMNVITVDWSRGSNKACGYVQGVANTQTVASEIKNFFVQLINSYKKIIPTDEWGNFHFVGHSLGAHVVGQAANLLKNNNVMIHRVTGLDPAQPCFKGVYSALRLSASDANFVDVIHTNGGKLGIFEPIGHVDFYVNGGKKQPGCSDFELKKFSLRNPTKYPMSVIFCNHNRAMTLFTQSLIQKIAKQCKFRGHSWNMERNERYNQRISDDVCNDNKCLEMGISAHNVDSEIKTFSVSTTGAAPYCDIY